MTDLFAFLFQKRGLPKTFTSYNVLIRKDKGLSMCPLMFGHCLCTFMVSHASPDCLSVSGGFGMDWSGHSCPDRQFSIHFPRPACLPPCPAQDFSASMNSTPSNQNIFVWVNALLASKPKLAIVDNFELLVAQQLCMSSCFFLFFFVSMSHPNPIQTHKSKNELSN